MPEKDEDINVNRRDDEKVVFESPLVQSIYDKIDMLRDETTDLLMEFDSTEFKQNIDEFDIEEFGENAIGHLSDFADDLSRFKDEMLGSDDVPEFVKKSSREVKFSLNRDEDYLRRARRKLDASQDEDFINKYKANLRVMELCDKAIDVNDSNHEAYYIKGLALINLEKYDIAIDVLIDCLVLDEENVDARLAIAKANRLNKDYEDAISIYDSVLQMDENPFEAYKGKAYVYYDMGEFKKASIAFKDASLIKSLDEKSLRIWDECLEN